MLKFLPLALVVSTIVSAGTYFHGQRTDRWNPPNSQLLKDFTDRVPKLPLRIGDWQGTEHRIPDKEFDLTNCTAYVSRRYVNRKTDEAVSVYVVSGTARHITIHSPDWCYQGAGYKMDGRPEQYSIPYGTDGEQAQFLTSAFRKSNPANPNMEEVLRIFWTFSDDGEWQGPVYWGGPKAYFSGRPAMYKIYLICNATGGDDPSAASAAASPANQLTKDVFSRFNEVLFTAANSESSGESPDESLESDLIVD